jgi:hypothetical protein
MPEHRTNMNDCGSCWTVSATTPKPHAMLGGHSMCPPILCGDPTYPARSSLSIGGLSRIPSSPWCSLQETLECDVSPKT